MARFDERKVAFRFCVTTVGWLGCVFAWVCVLSFDVADPPSTSIWPPNQSVVNLCGPAGAWVAYYLFYYLGTGTYALVALLSLAVIAWSKEARFYDPWLRLVGLVLACTVVSTWGVLFNSASDEYLVTGAGGVLGAATARFCLTHLQTTGTHIVLMCALLVGLLLAADNLVLPLFRWARWTGRRSIPVLTRGGNAVAGVSSAVASGMATRIANLSGRSGPNGPHRPAGVAEAPRSGPPTVGPARQLTFETDEDAEGGADRKPTDAAEDRTKASASGAPGQPAVRDVEPRLPPLRGAARAGARLPADDDYKLPGLQLLEPPTPVDGRAVEALCRDKAYILEQTLNEFRVGVQVVSVETGPVITVFELKLAAGIKVSQIASLSNDMARALKAPAVRVVAPLPGRNTIGIEVPNVDKEKVRLRDVMSTFEHRSRGLAIPLYLGKDASGRALVSDLTQMPHVLIAGTTGSGKSICIFSLLSSILMARSPAEVNLIMVDPKIVELAPFKDIPHLMCPIITDVTKAEGVLEWATTLMDERYALLAEVGVREIRGYNRLGREGLKQRLHIDSDQELERVPVHLPYIVFVIDELADLMMTSAKEVEFNLCRLAQKSRAVGIHLIVSTQRPQANVVTGLIKSNLPTRICFRVSSRLDSRIVLDQNGGETLVGQGDMLFLGPGTSKLVRAQGTFVSDDELRNIVSHCKEQRQPSFHPELVRMPGVRAEAASERDELFDRAVDAVLDTGRGSVSLLQRHLNVGYGRASRLIDQMYEAGIVGEYKGSQAREILMSKEEWEAVRSQRDREEADEEAGAPVD